ncbi:MAG: SIS domain-containing protein [Nitrosarchaeum sp.]|nr:SIS domain-containing protein [Nitrosarchaeum sp.]
MHKFYDLWPEIAIKSYESDLSPVEFSEIDHIVFSGMGGSGAIGDLFSAILSKTSIHVNVVKGYLLPKTIDSNTLVIPISVSGNTTETLHVLKSTLDLKCKTIAFSCGGLFESFCSDNGIQYRKLQMHHSPRTSFVSIAYSLLNVLRSVIPIKPSDVTESINEMKKLSGTISSGNLTDTNQSLELAEWLRGIPLIYYPAGLQAAAIRFKNSLQENAKIHCIVEDVIEASHNNIMSWEKPSDVTPILLRGSDDYIKTKERWEILKEYFDKNNIQYKEVNSPQGSMLTKITSLVYMLDYASIYKAILSGTDPGPVKSIDFVKSRLV